MTVHLLGGPTERCSCFVIMQTQFSEGALSCSHGLKVQDGLQTYSSQCGVKKWFPRSSKMHPSSTSTRERVIAKLVTTTELYPCCHLLVKLLQEFS